MVNSFNAVPGNDCRQVAHWRFSNDPAGTWTTAITALALPAFFGGNGSATGVVLGKFEPHKSTYTPNTEAKALNAGKNERHLMLDRTGLWAIFERDDGVFLSSRAKVGTDFAAPKQVSGFGTLKDVTPALGSVGGQPKVFYTDYTSILMQDIDLANAKLVGTPVPVSRTLQAGGKPFGASPLHGADGDVEGLWISELMKPHTGTNTGDSDLVFASDLDPATPPVMRIQRPDFTAFGGIAGGFLSFTHDINVRWHLMHSEAAFLLGDVEKPGGTIDLWAAGVNPLANTSLLTVVYIAANPASKVVIPGFGGDFALDLASVVQLGAIVHPGIDGVGTASIPLPNDPKLSGIKVATQGIVLNPNTGSRTFTNTAWIRIL